MNSNHDIEKRTLDLVDKHFLGIIEDIDDPKKEGRAKIRVISIFDDIPIEALPWAYPKQKSTFFGQGGQGGSISIPKVGSIVVVTFNNGSEYSPEYYSIHELANDVKTELSQDNEYFGTHIILFDGDEELKIWFTINKGITIQLKGSRINIGNDKAITIEHDQLQSLIELRGDNINIKSNKLVNITSPQCVVDSGNIQLGKDAIESLIKGDSFMNFFNTHIHPSTGAPPAVPMTLALLSQISKTK